MGKIYHRLENFKTITTKDSQIVSVLHPCNVFRKKFFGRFSLKDNDDKRSNEDIGDNDDNDDNRDIDDNEQSKRLAT